MNPLPESTELPGVEVQGISRYEPAANGESADIVVRTAEGDYLLRFPFAVIGDAQVCLSQVRRVLLGRRQEMGAAEETHPILATAVRVRGTPGDNLLLDVNANAGNFQFLLPQQWARELAKALTACCDKVDARPIGTTPTQ